jgi:hypothetical protein
MRTEISLSEILLITARNALISKVSTNYSLFEYFEHIII